MDDYIYLVYIPHIPHVIEFSNGVQSVVEVRNDVALVKIPKKFESVALMRKAGCCGNETKAFRIASKEEINKFLGVV